VFTPVRQGSYDGCYPPQCVSGRRIIDRAGVEWPSPFRKYTQGSVGEGENCECESRKIRRKLPHAAVSRDCLAGLHGGGGTSLNFSGGQ
jgi:hypothetical protein